VHFDVSGGLAVSYILSPSRTFVRLLLAIGGALALAGAAGCAGHHATTAADEDTQALAQDGSDTSATENDTETLATSFVASNTATLGLASAGDLGGGQLQLSDVGDAVKAAYSPAGCVVVTNDTTNRTVTYVFNGCTGPFGLLDVTGEIKIAWQTPAVNKLVLDFTGTSLKVNRATVDWSAHAEIIAGLRGKRDMTWNAHLSGTTARGREFTRANNKSIAWTVGEACVLVNGSSDGNVTGRAIHVDVINYSRCKGECPAAGSEVRITNTNTGKSIDITCDGGNQATFTGPNGGQTQITLACGL
jgi:hypothetical protein